MRPITFICLLMSLLFCYRLILSLLILFRKKFIIDEQSYIYLVYLFIVCIVVIFTKNIIIGIVGACLTPLVIIIYLMVVKKRIYWIVNGVHTNLASYGNALIEFDSKYKDGHYAKNHILLKKVEGKIKITFEDVSLEEKEQILKIFKKIAKEHASKWSTRQFIYALINFVIFVIFLSLTILY